MLTQKLIGYVSESTTLVEVRGNCFAGLACTGQEFRGIGITPEGIVVESDGQCTLVRKGRFRKLYLRIRNNCLQHSHQFYYSQDGRTFLPAGEPFTMHNGHWKGVRIGLFCYGQNGQAHFDSFQWEEKVE